MPVLRHVVDHGHKGVQIIRRAPWHAHAKLHQNGVGDDAFAGQLFGKPQMACIKRLNFNTHARCHHARGHIAQHAGGVDHDIIGFVEIHRAAIKGANFGAAFHHMGHTFGRARHIGFGRHAVHGFGAVKQQIAAHACGKV